MYPRLGRDRQERRGGKSACGLPYSGLVKSHCPCVVAKGRPIRPQVLLRRSDIFRLDAHAVIDCDAQFLFAAQVRLCCLDRDV